MIQEAEKMKRSAAEHTVISLPVSFSDSSLTAHSLRQYHELHQEIRVLDDEVSLSVDQKPSVQVRESEWI
jgi:hypothetical protein